MKQTNLLTFMHAKLVGNTSCVDICIYILFAGPSWPFGVPPYTPTHVAWAQARHQNLSKTNNSLATDAGKGVESHLAAELRRQQQGC